MVRTRIAVALALVPLALVACAPGGGQRAEVTSTGQPAAPAQSSTPTGTPTTSPSIPPSLSPSAETSSSPAAKATVDKNTKVIYLTFDDGPWVPYTQQVLDVLAKHDATATFFVVGEMAAQHPALLRQITAAGHAIGNHTWDHSNLIELPDDQIRWQLRKTARVVGPAIAACMRPPYGGTNDRVDKVVKDEGYKLYLWDYWAEDWLQPPVPAILDSLEIATENKSNILLHDGGGDRPNTVEALRIMIPRWIKRGYTFQALPGCLTPHSAT